MRCSRGRSRSWSRASRRCRCCPRRTCRARVGGAHARAEEGARAAASGAIPPNGWATGGDTGAGAFPDLALLMRLLDSARGALPPELARQLADALRELLVALRAVIDYSIA